MRFTLDTTTILAFVREEKDGDLLEGLFRSIRTGAHQGFISSISIAEIYAVLSRVGEAERAAGTVILLKEAGIQSIPLDDGIAKNAGLLKAKYARVLKGFSYADAAIVGTALRSFSDMLVTYDKELFEVNEVRAVPPARITL